MNRAERRRHDRATVRHRRVSEGPPISKHGRSMFVYDGDLGRAVTEIDWQRATTVDEVLAAAWPGLDPDDGTWDVAVAFTFAQPEALIDWTRQQLDLHGVGLLSQRAVVETFCEHIKDAVILEHPLLTGDARLAMQIRSAGEPVDAWLHIAMMARAVRPRTSTGWPWSR